MNVRSSWMSWFRSRPTVNQGSFCNGPFSIVIALWLSLFTPFMSPKAQFWRNQNTTNHHKKNENGEREREREMRMRAHIFLMWVILDGISMHVIRNKGKLNLMSDFVCIIRKGLALQWQYMWVDKRKFERSGPDEKCKAIDLDAKGKSHLT